MAENKKIVENSNEDNLDESVASLTSKVSEAEKSIERAKNRLKKIRHKKLEAEYKKSVSDFNELKSNFEKSNNELNSIKHDLNEFYRIYAKHADRNLIGSFVRRFNRYSNVIEKNKSKDVNRADVKTNDNKLDSDNKLNSKPVNEIKSPVAPNDKNVNSGN